ncbi:hypothetical protein CBER1_07767 [Cercospora berteroae]|uniref:Rad60/SUMO-like domain-containing protein n=1 Tax=Cercospora berteroae TaxID=357750 RepID=A0A2S6C3S6_9PEZI|nr:hypothetical protein CBER1_07767 [Cercospora berteroae]
MRPRNTATTVAGLGGVKVSLRELESGHSSRGPERPGNPLNVFDDQLPTDANHVLLTMASEFSAFALTFKLRRDQPLKEVKEKFGSCVDWRSQDLSYIFEDRIVQDDDTPEQLSMRPSGNMVLISAQKEFSGACSAARQQEIADAGVELLRVTDEKDCIAFWVRVGLAHGKEYCKQYRIRWDCNLAHVMRDFDALIGRGGSRFILDGDRINNGDTPSTLEMEGDDLVDVLYESFAG